ncbi:MAG TPA: sensor histidine kinase, partial [Bacillota bacterium]|nr:sensor histidine kinase [Bacillota bacterium]
EKKMNQKRLLFLLLILFLGVEAKPQTPQIDTVINLLKKEMPDTSRAFNMRKLATLLETVDTARARTAYREAIDFAKTKKLNFETAEAYSELSSFNQAQGKYQEAKLSGDSALLYLEKSDDERVSLRKAQIYGTLAGSYRFMNNFEKAVEYQIRQTELYEKVGNTGNIVKSYLNLAILFSELQNHEKQEEYARKGLAYARSMKSDRDIFLSYYIIAYGLSDADKYEEATKYVDSAKLYYEKGHDLDPDMAFGYHLVAGGVYSNVGRYEEAYDEFKIAYEFADANGLTFSKYQSLMQMGNIRRLQKRFAEAEKILLDASSAVEQTGELTQKSVLWEDLYKLYKDWGKYEKALNYHEMLKEVEDSISNKEIHEVTADLEKKYETEKKEGTIQLQKAEIRQRKTMNYLFGGGAGALAVILLLTYRTYHQKQRLQKQHIIELEKEQQLNAAQAVLKGEEQERARLAKDLHDGLSGMLSGIKYSLQDMKGNLIMTEENRQAFERSMDMLDSSIQEMRRVAHNMMPEALVRYGLDAALKDYIAEINKSGMVKVVYQSMGMEKREIEKSPAIAIYRIVQELLNNVIKHAQATEALVQLFNENGKLVVNVEDNGRGFDTKLSEEKGGMGWRNIRSRVELLNGKIDLQSSPQSGTAVNLEFNIT